VAGLIPSFAPGERPATKRRNLSSILQSMPGRKTNSRPLQVPSNSNPRRSQHGP